MAKALLMSVLAATLAVPMITARDPQPARGLSRAALGFALFVALWAYSLIHVLPSLKD